MGVGVRYQDKRIWPATKPLRSMVCDIRVVPKGDTSNGFTRVCSEGPESIRQSKFSVGNVGNPAPGIKSQIRNSRWQHCSAMPAASSARQRGRGFADTLSRPWRDIDEETPASDRGDHIRINLDCDRQG